MNLGAKPWILATWFAGAILIAVGVSLTDRSILFALSPVVLMVMVGGAAYAFAMITGQRWAMALLLVVSVTLFSTELRTESYADRGGGYDLISVIKLGVFALGFLGGVILLPQSYNRLFTMPGLFLLIYLGWALLTAPMSLAPIYSMAMAFGFAAWMLFACGLSVRFNHKEVMILVLLALSVFLLGSLLFYAFIPELGRFESFGMARLTGMAATPNEAGQMGALYLVTLFAFYVEDGFREIVERVWLRRWIFISSGMALAVLVMAQSRGAIGSCILAIAAGYIQRIRVAWIALLATLVLIPIGVALVLASPAPVSMFDEQASGLTRSGDTAELTSFAGRQNIWIFASGKIAESPIMGYGYGVGGRIIADGYRTRWGETTSSAHNAFIQTSLDLGFVGAFFFAGVFIWGMIAFFRHPAPFRDSMFVIVLLTCLLESGTSKAASTLALLWFISLLASENANHRDEDQPQMGRDE